MHAAFPSAILHDHKASPVSSRGLSRLLLSARSRTILLQTLVGIIVSYELLFGTEMIIGRSASHLLAGAFALISAIIMLMPKSALETAWFSGGLIALNTALVTAAIYLSGNASSELYMTYFLVMLIASSMRTLGHMLGLSMIICCGYGALVCQAVLQAEQVSVGRLLGIPVLLVMAVFYGLMLETASVERQRSSKLNDNVRHLQQAEETLVEKRVELESRVKGLKKGLSRANQEIRQGVLERQGLERRLREAQKLETVGRLASGIATEFNQLLAVIGKQTGIMFSKMKPEDPLQSPVEEMFRSGERVALLTARLLSLHEQHEKIRPKISLGSVCQDLEGILRGLLPQHITLRVFVDAVPALIEMDRDHLENIILHLVANARDAMSAGGTVTVEVGIVTGEKLPVEELQNNRTQGMVMLAISDTGPGMSHDIQSQMFEPFFSTKVTNMGLGLTLVHGMVRQHGGTVDVESHLGRGTTVRIFFPIEPSAGPIHQRGESPGPVSHDNHTILIVESDEIERKLAVATLNRHRYRVLEAESPVQALMVAHQHSGPIHLAVSNLSMEDISGRELVRRLVVHHPMMKALFVSGFTDETMARHRLNKRYCLHRPYRQNDLTEKIGELLAG